MSWEKPGSKVSSDSGVAMEKPGRMTPPTNLRKLVFCSVSAAFHRSIASESARRTLASLKGGRLALKVIRILLIQGVSEMVTLSPSASLS